MRFATPFLFLKHVELNQTVFKTALYLSILTSSLFYFTIENLYAFMLNNAVLGVCLSLILPFLDVTAIKNLGKDKYGKSRLFGSIGFMLVSLILAKFLSEPKIALNYYLCANVLTVIFALLLVKNDVTNVKNIEDESFSFFKYWPFWSESLFLRT